VQAGNGGFIEYEVTECFSATTIALSVPETHSNMSFKSEISLTN